MKGIQTIIQTQELLHDLLLQSYRKLKSSIYYSNGLSHMKLKIADFEFDKTLFDLKLKDLSISLWTQDNKYFSLKYRSIKYIVIPKLSTSKNINENSQVIDTEQDISLSPINKVNFFIDADIELFILDTFWTILYGRVYVEKYEKLSYLRANVFEYNLYNKKNTSFIDSINFSSLSIFKAYYSEYAKWKNHAIDSVEELYDNGKDSIIISMDIKSYFYNVNVDFDKILTYFLDIDSTLIEDFHKFDYITNIIKQIYTKYSFIISQLLNNLGGRTILPIGLMSSAVLANTYLVQLDQDIKLQSDCIYYSRYVDDIVIVLQYTKIQNIDVSLVQKLIPNVFKVAEKVYTYIADQNIMVQDEKLKLIYIPHTASNQYISRLKIEIGNASEPHLLPDISLDIDHFLMKITEQKNESIKIRDSSYIDINQKALFQFIRSYLMGNKGKELRKDSKEQRQEIFSQITKLLTFPRMMQLYSRWDKLFSLYILFDEKIEDSLILYEQITSGINRLETKLDDIYIDHKQSAIVHCMKKTLKQFLCIQMGQVISLNSRIRGVSKVNKNIRDIAKKLFRANMFDHNLLFMPFINYIEGIENYKGNLYKARSERFIREMNNFEIDERKIQLSPKFIHHSDYALCSYLFESNIMGKSGQFTQINDSYKSIYKYFGDETELDGYVNVTLASSDFDGIDVEYIDFVGNQLKYESNLTYIGLANVNVTKQKPIINGKINYDASKYLNRKSELYDILNDSYIYKYSEEVNDSPVIYGMKTYIENIDPIEAPIQFLIFPEVSIPVEWLPDILFFSRKTGISITCGLKYIKKGDQIYNVVATILPFKNANMYKSAYLFIREKNDYSHFEKEIAPYNLVKCIDRDVPFYQIFNWMNTKFTVFNCFELTDIKARAFMQGKIDLLMSIQYNKDVNYFSSIVQSVSREVFCFVAQSNSSDFGGTQVSGPFHGFQKDIISVSGGERNSVHIGKVDINRLREFHNVFISEDYKRIKEIERECDSKIKKDPAGIYRHYAAPSARFKHK